MEKSNENADKNKNTVRSSKPTFEPVVSCFKNVTSIEPYQEVRLYEFLSSSKHKALVMRYRSSKDDEERIHIKKHLLPCVTVSGIFDTRSKKRLLHKPSSCICIDIDGKQNPRVQGRWERVKAMVAYNFNSLYYAGLSLGGNGLCLVFKILSPEKHKEHFNALVDEIWARTGLVADESGSDVVRLRVASYDDNPYFNTSPRAYLFYKRLPNMAPRRITKARNARMQDATIDRVKVIYKKIKEGRIDVTQGRKNWLAIGRALATEFGEDLGRNIFHTISSFHPNYSYFECEEVYDWCIKNCSNTDIATFFYICKKHGVTFKD